MFIAKTRFSLLLPGSNSWVATRSIEDINEYKNKLYEETRLNFRINFLTHITLPLLESASKGHSFLHIIEYSDSLPIKYISLLKELEERYIFVKLNVYDEEGKPEIEINDFALEYFSLEKKQHDVWLGMFILDDDDCISLNYFNVMRQYLVECFESFYVSMGLGVVGVFDENYKIEHYAEMYKPKINIGFMNVGRYDSSFEKIVFTKKITAHMRMDKLHRVLLDSREIGFYWSRHHHQDTRLDKTQRNIDKVMISLKALPLLEEEQLNKNFGSDFVSKLQNFDKDGNFVNK